MRRLSRRPGAKAIAWLLLAAVLFTGIASGLGVALWYGCGGHYDGGAYLRQQLLHAACAQTAPQAYYMYYAAVKDDSSDRLYWENRFSSQNSNFGFTLTDGDGKVLLQNFAVAQAQYSYQTEYTVPTNAQYTVHEYFDTYEAALQRQEALSATNDYIGTSQINESAWQYGVTCRLQSLPDIVEAPPTTESEPDQSTELVEPADVRYGEDGYHTYYFHTEEDLNQWYTQQGRNYEIKVQESFREPSQYELYMECFKTEVITLTAKIPVPGSMTARDNIWYRLELVQLLSDNHAVWIPSLAISCVLFLLLIVFLFCGAGRRAGSDEAHLRWCDRVPLEFLFFAGVLAICIPILIGTEIMADWSVLAALTATVPVALFCIWILTSCAARLKARCFWRSTIVGWLCYVLLCGCRRVVRWLKYVMLGLPMVWQIAVAWLVLSFVELLLILSFNGVEFIWVLERLILTPVLLLVGIQLTRLRQGARRIADGDLSTQVDLRYMVGDIRRHGQDLNSITDGLQSAVDERMRSERLKTELITNVSHDIKTPLTSIVNYVDLLSQEEMPSEAAKEYLEVLKRQSARLRKLTEDLVEASKAATGNVETRPEAMDVNVLLAQTTGEFEEKLRELQLEPILTLEEEPAMIFADGRLLWRVFDNLMNNICKYALPGTRVYLSAQRKEGQIEIVFRNISRFPLNISSNELVERFVRGDASRSTEGSGLGLSIAKSLTDLQGGDFELTVDGDLFKAIVRFPAM